MFENLWVEKYRPQTLDEMVLSDKNKSVFDKFKQQEGIPNLLFAGPAGIGKTSLAKILCNSVLQCQYLYINASDENGIDTIRSKVTNFSRTKSFDGKIKCIILDETDGLTVDAQRALRNTMEEHSAITRFILTANYNHRVIPPLQSRCQSFDLTPPVDRCVDRVMHILSIENVKLADEDKLHKFVKTCYPDLRKCINEIQKNIIDGELQLDNLIKVKDAFVEALYKITTQGLSLKARKKVIENEHVFGGDYTELLRAMFNYIHDEHTIDDVTKAEQLVMVSEHMYRAAFVMDPEINFYTCLLNLAKK
jgi:replication factor C small subunit